MFQTHHKFARALALMLALACLCLGASAQSDGQARALDIEFTVKPAEMVAPGDTTMTFVIVNNTDRVIQNVYLSSDDGLLSEPIGAIGAGETQTLVRPHTVTQDELDAGVIRYVVSHDAVEPGGQKVSYPVEAAVAKGAPRPNVDFTRQLSSSVAAPGTQVTITYRITNTGNVPVSAIRIRDSLGNFTGRAEQLGEGESKTFISRVPINEDSASEPALEYAMPTGESYTVRLDAAPIRVADCGLETAFSVALSAFDPDTAEAVLVLTNTGACDWPALTVTDDVYGGVIAENIALPASETPVEVHYSYPVRNDGPFRWRVSGVSENGESVDTTTESLTLERQPEIAAVVLSLEAVARTPRINRAGTVTFDIAVNNAGSVMAQNALVYEINRGEVRRFAVLPTGEPSRCSVSYEVRGDSQFIFCVNYADADGRQRTISAPPIEVTIGADGVAPERLEGEAEQLEGRSVKVGNSSALTGLLIAAGGALAVLFALLLVTTLRQRRGRRARAAAERQRVREELGKTAQFTPIKQNGKKK